jgi:hypothetical protein
VCRQINFRQLAKHVTLLAIVTKNLRGWYSAQNKSVEKLVLKKSHISCVNFTQEKILIAPNFIKRFFDWIMTR